MKASAGTDIVICGRLYGTEGTDGKVKHSIYMYIQGKRVPWVLSFSFVYFKKVHEYLFSRKKYTAGLNMIYGGAEYDHWRQII